MKFMCACIVSVEHTFLLCEKLYLVTGEHIESLRYTYIDYHKTYNVLTLLQFAR